MTAAELARLHARAAGDLRHWSAAEFTALLAHPGAHLSADAAGISLGRTVAGEAELLMIATLPELRRQGHARRHLAAFEAGAHRRGAATAFLEVAEDNAPARSLYAAAGYVEAGRRPGYYRRASGPAVAALVLRKPLADE